MYVTATNPFISTNFKGFNPEQRDNNNPLSPSDTQGVYPLNKSLVLVIKRFILTQKNKKMKITNYIKMLVVLIVFTACENDLDTAPEDRFTAGSFYKNASDIDAAVNAAYGGLQKNGLYGFNYHILIETRSDNTFEEEPSNSGGFGDVDLFNRVTTNSVFRQTWVDSYVTIQAANIVLNRIDAITDMDNALKETRKGEMKFIRALVYYNLVNLYGAVPLVLQETTNPTDYFGQGRTSVQDVFTQIIKDLDEASDALPESNDIGRANKGASLILLGKAHLTLGNPTEAETALRAINGVYIYKYLCRCIWYC